MIALPLLFLFGFFGIYLNVWLLLTFLEHRGTFFTKRKIKNLPRVSILIPAHNEERGIQACLKSVQNLDYPKDKHEVIIIDNGSTDNTVKIAKSFKNIKVIKLGHPSKADALNVGLKAAKYEIIGILDADSIVSSEALKKLVAHFDDGVAGVTSFVKIDSNKGILGKFQQLEYLVFGLMKKLLSSVETFYVLPGTLSLVRTNLIKNIRFSKDTLTEDMDIGFELIKRNYRIVNSLEAHVTTEVPKSFMAWLKQRLRWYRGYIQNTVKHRDVIFSFKNPTIFGWFIVPITGYIAVAIGMFLTFLLFSNYVSSALLWTESFFYISTVDQAALFLRNLNPFTGMFIQPYAMITYIILFSSSATLVILGMKFLNSLKKENILFLPLYLSIYYVAVTFAWAISLVLEIIRWKRKW